MSTSPSSVPFVFINFVIMELFGCYLVCFLYCRIFCFFPHIKYYHELVRYTLKPSFHIVISDGDVPASPGTWRQCIGSFIKSWTELNFSNLYWDVGEITKKTFPYHRKRPSSIADPVTGTRPKHLRRYGTRPNRSGVLDMFFFTYIIPPFADICKLTSWRESNKGHSQAWRVSNNCK